jgi:hypothetical protein
MRASNQGGRVHSGRNQPVLLHSVSLSAVAGARDEPQSPPISTKDAGAQFGIRATELTCGQIGCEVFIACLTPDFLPSLNSGVTSTWR